MAKGLGIRTKQSQSRWIRRPLPRILGARSPLLVAMVVVVGLFSYSVSNGTPVAAAQGPTTPPPVRLANESPPALPADAHPTAATKAEAQQPLTVTVTLNRTDEGGFQTFLAGVQDPASPRYRHFLSQAQLADRFGPSQGAYDAVVSWLTSEGFKVAERSANRLTVSVAGSRADVEKAFGVQINEYEKTGHRFYENTIPPAVPASIAGYIENVGGLSSIGAPTRPNNNRLPAECLVYDVVGGASVGGLTSITVLELVAALLAITVPILFILGLTLSVLAIGSGLVCLAAIAAGRRGVSLGSGSSQVSAPSPGGLRKPAPLANSAATPQKIGLLEYDTYHPSDVADWLAVLGADPAIASRLSEVHVHGGVSTPGSGESEVLLDIATVMQLTPSAPTQYVVYDAPMTTSFEAMFNAMINDGVTIISNSWTACEDQVSQAGAQAIDSVLAQAAAAGISVLNGAGDSGSTCSDGSPNTVGVPADSPHATAVGGTSAKPSVGGLYAGETYWDGTMSTPPTGKGGFGVSKYFARPPYQNGLSSSSMRSIPDLSAIADPTDGVQICQADAGGCPTGLSFGGTSMSAPVVAAEVANINIEVGSNIGELNPALYPLGGTPAFESPTNMGSDFAHVGLGSPDEAHIALALSGAPTGPVDATVSTAISSGTAPADGNTVGLVDAFLSSANGAPVSGKAVSVTTSSPTAVVKAIIGTSTNNGGAVSFRVTDTVPEIVTFTVTDTTDGITLVSHPTITFVPPTATGASIIASPTTVANDGTSKATVTVYLEDALHRPASGKTVSLSAGGSNAVISPSSRQAVTDSSGQATFTVTDTNSESVAFTAVDVTDGNLPVPGSAAVNFTATAAACANDIPTAVSGFSASAFVTGLAFNTSTVVFPGNVTFPACSGQSPPAFDPAGNAYVSNQTDGSIHVFGPSGGVASPANQLPGASFAPGALGNLVFGKDGSLYAGLVHLGDNISNPEIVQLDPATGTTLRVVASSETGLPDCPFVLAVDPLSGDLFTDDECSGFAASNQITRIANPAGVNPTVSAYVTTSGGNLGLAFAPDGTIYLANSAASTIDRIGGTDTTSPTVTSVASVSSGTPASVAVASVGPSGNATMLDVFSFGGTVSQIDLTTTPPSVAPVASGSSNFFIQATTAGGCVYAPLPGSVVRFGPTSCGSSPPTTSGPQMTLTGTGLSRPPTGSPVTFTAQTQNVSAPTGTPIRFVVSGANSQVKLVNADASGKAVFAYSGVFPGTDRVIAVAVVDGRAVTSAPISFRWVAGKDTSFLSLNQSQGGGPVGRPARLAANLVDVAKTPPTPIPNALVTIGLGTQTCAATTDGAGNATCMLTPTGPPGLVPVTATYAGSTRFTPASATDSFALTAPVAGQAPAITSAPATTFTVGAGGSFTVVATGSPAPTLSETGTLPSGVTFNASTGVLAGTPAAGTVGTYPVSFTATNGINPDATQSFTLTAAKATTTTTVSASPPNPALGADVTFTANVAPSLPNALSPSGTVRFFVDGQANPAATKALTGGTAGFTTAALGAGSHTVVATYSGDANFATSTASTTTLVGKPTPTLRTKASPPVDAGVGKVKDTATLAGGLAPTGSITFALYGPNTCAGPAVFSSMKQVNGNGVYVSARFTPTAPGTYQWRASYSGDANNNAVAATPCGDPAEMVVVRPSQPTPCPTTITGKVTGPVVVAAGKHVCYLNATVTGGITVNRGGELTVTNSIVEGGIRSTGARALDLCGNDIRAASSGTALAVANTGGPIRIGDPATGCLGNAIRGDASLTNNFDRLVFGNNHVTNRATFSGNTGGPIVVKNNLIVGALACKTNLPAPSNAGQPNTAGSKTGQCVGL